VEELSESFPGSSHVRFLGLDQADDETIWSYAKEHEFVVVTFDSDFYELGLVYGFPPKVIWLRCSDTSTENILALLKHHYLDITDFGGDPKYGCLELA
jgi:predicted nuclease of predicted toxin-antitoxin system